MKKKSAPGPAIEVISRSIFHDSDNAAKQIVAAAAEVFQHGWDREVQRLEKLFFKFKEIKEGWTERRKAAEVAGDWTLVNDIEKVHYEEHFRMAYFDLKHVNGKVSHNDYQRFKEVLRTNEKMHKKGFDVVVEELKEVFFGIMSGNMRRALEKHAIHTYPKARLVNIRTGDGGYEVTCYVDSRRLVTQCIGAGGHNIQTFHYRYLIHHKEPVTL